MAKPTAQNLAKQVGKITEEAIKDIANAPGAVAGKVIEQMGASSTQSQQGQKTNPVLTAEQQDLKRKEVADKIKTDRQIAALKQKLEAEMEKARQIRQQQMQQRRAVPQEAEKPSVEEPLVEPASKKPRGLFAGLRARKDQSQPELVGKRVGG